MRQKQNMENNFRNSFLTVTLPYITPSLLFFNISLFFNLFAFQLISLILLILFRFLLFHFESYLFFRLNRLIIQFLSLYLSHYISQNFFVCLSLSFCNVLLILFCCTYFATKTFCNGIKVNSRASCALLLLENLNKKQCDF